MITVAWGNAGVARGWKLASPAHAGAFSDGAIRIVVRFDVIALQASEDYLPTGF